MFVLYCTEIGPVTRLILALRDTLPLSVFAYDLSTVSWSPHYDTARWCEQLEILFISGSGSLRSKHYPVLYNCFRWSTTSSLYPSNWIYSSHEHQLIKEVCCMVSTEIFHVRVIRLRSNCNKEAFLTLPRLH